MFQLIFLSCLVISSIAQDAPSGAPEPCKTKEGLDGECVPYYLCSANGTIIEDGSNLIDIRNGEGPCPQYMDQCCTSQQIVDTPITPAPPPAETRRTGCGIRNPQGVNFRITGNKDNEAEFGEFPWMVALLKPTISPTTQKKLNVFQCGGSLIHPSVVLTAAHCIPKENPTQLKIRAGEWDTQTKEEIFPHQDRNVASFVVHKHYYSGGLFNDIALIFLDKPMELADHIGVICLPPQSNYAPSGRCAASGWGKDVFGKKGQYQVILKKVEVPTVPKKQCQAALRKTRLGDEFELHQSFICAGGEAGKDTCKGDGGSPLACLMPNKNRYMQSGIISWGIGCGETGTPGVYTNVAYLRQWIDDQLYIKNIDISGFLP